MIDSVVFALIFVYKTSQAIPGQVLITLKLHWNFNYTEENETAIE